MLDESATQVERIEQLKKNQLYKLQNGDSRKDFFTVGDFFWNDENDSILGITETSDLSTVEIDSEEVDETNSFGSINYFNGYCANPPIENLKRHIREGRYLHIGPVEEFRDKIPEE